MLLHSIWTLRASTLQTYGKVAILISDRYARERRPVIYFQSENVLKQHSRRSWFDVLRASVINPLPGPSNQFYGTGILPASQTEQQH